MPAAKISYDHKSRHNNDYLLNISNHLPLPDVIMKDLQEIAVSLLHWYSAHGRDLPWRRAHDTYNVWVSEIIMQQTRIEQGTAYYYRFISEFPDVGLLADAPEDDVLAVWQGLGYYSRARNMQKTARSVVMDYQGVFPTDYDSLLKLPGIGPYTAAAISSICSGEKKLALDGNLNRIFSRLFGIDFLPGSGLFKKCIVEIEEDLLINVPAGDFNQAMMDLGSAVCKPHPECGACPLQERCFAFTHRQTDRFPLKKKKTDIRTRYLYYIMASTPDDEFLLRKRTASDIWQGLYEFPLIESGESIQDAVLSEPETYYATLQTNCFSIEKISPVIKHQLSHQKLLTRVVKVRLKQTKTSPEFLSVKRKDLHKYPLPRLIDRFLEENNDFYSQGN